MRGSQSQAPNSFFSNLFISRNPFPLILSRSQTLSIILFNPGSSRANLE
jgi:hypothetical protein